MYIYPCMYVYAQSTYIANKILQPSNDTAKQKNLHNIMPFVPVMTTAVTDIIIALWFYVTLIK